MISGATHDETSLNKTEEGTTSVERVFAVQECLHGGYQAPAHHLDWDPPIRTQLLGDKLTWQFGTQEREVKYGYYDQYGRFRILESLLCP